MYVLVFTCMCVAVAVAKDEEKLQQSCTPIVHFFFLLIQTEFVCVVSFLGEQPDK